MRHDRRWIPGKRQAQHAYTFTASKPNSVNAGPARAFARPSAPAEAGERAAILYTLIESCRTHGLDPFAGLRDVLTLLPTWSARQIHELTPAACAKAARTATP